MRWKKPRYLCVHVQTIKLHTTNEVSSGDGATTTTNCRMWNNLIQVKSYTRLMSNGISFRFNLFSKMAAKKCRKNTRKWWNNKFNGQTNRKRNSKVNENKRMAQWRGEQKTRVNDKAKRLTVILYASLIYCEKSESLQIFFHFIFRYFVWRTMPSRKKCNV